MRLAWRNTQRGVGPAVAWPGTAHGPVLWPLLALAHPARRPVASAQSRGRSTSALSCLCPPARFQDGLTRRYFQPAIVYSTSHSLPLSRPLFTQPKRFARSKAALRHLLFLLMVWGLSPLCRQRFCCFSRLAAAPSAHMWQALTRSAANSRRDFGKRIHYCKCKRRAAHL